jgi:hypothetical protein
MAKNEYQIGLEITFQLSEAIPNIMAYLRDLAVKLIRATGEGITADHLRMAALIPKRERGANNFMGSVFRHDPQKRFVQTGKRVRSKTDGSHGNDLPVWTLKELVK